jgi:hypothetical protein
MDLTFDATREQLRPSATGDAVELVTLQAPGVICEVCSFGATLVSVRLGGVVGLQYYYVAVVAIMAITLYMDRLNLQSR